MTNQRTLLILLAALIAASTARVIDNAVSSSEESQEMEEFLGEMQSTCLKMTGSNETYQKLVAESYKVPMCVMTKLDMENFSNDLDGLSESTRVSFFSKYCPQAQDSLSCLNPAADQLRKCLDQEEIEVLEIVLNLMPEALNFICKDHGQIFFMDDANFDECSDNFMGYAEKCMDKISNTTDAMDLSTYGQKQCDELAQVRQCFEAQLVECKSPRLMDLFDMFYRPVVKATPCKDFIKFDELPEIESNAV